jgi:LuxR family maltose regulon positive regulatory protein
MSDGAVSVRLARPRLGRVIERLRLFDQLDALDTAPGLWISGPAGAGKTTLVATWLQCAPEPVRWLRLDAEDAAQATFARLLDQLWRDVGSRDVAWAPAGRDELAEPAAWLKRRLHAVLPQMPSAWRLVVDNVHELPADSPMLVALASALAELPDGVRWIFISRERPPPAFSGALARQHLQVLQPQALALDEDETRRLVRLHGRGDAVLDALRPAQGWAAGLTLMLLGRPEAEHLPAFDAPGRLFDFFMAEVLARMPASDQDVLCRLALLPRVTPALALHVGREASAPALLERLAADSLFVERHAGGDTPFYVLHALFGAFLRRRLEQVTPADVLRDVKREVAAAALRDGQRDAAIGLLIEAGAADAAADALDRHALDYLAEGRTGVLAAHLDRLPAAAAERLSLWRGLCALESDPARALACAHRAEALAAAAGDAVGLAAAVALAANALVPARRTADIGPWIDRLEAAGVDPCRPRDDPRERVMLPGLLAALVLHRPWHRWTGALADRAEQLLRPGQAQAERLLLAPLAFHFLWRGELDRLDRLIDRVDALCRSPLASPASLLRWWSLGILVKALTGRVESAAADLERALALVDTTPALATQRCAVELLACMVATAGRDAAALRRHLARAAAAIEPGNAADLTMLQQQSGVAALLQGDAAEALRLTRAAVASGRDSGFAIRHHIALLSNALAAELAGATDEAHARLDEARAHPIHAVCRYHQWFASLLAAWLALGRQDVGAAVSELRAAMAIARDGGYRDAPLLMAAEPVMPALMALALAHGIEPALAREIVRRHNLAPPPDAGEDWPWPVRIRTLGELVVEVDGAPMASSRKESRRLLELLSLLAAHGHGAVPMTTIADMLWPDADGDAAREALDNAVYRLRKALGGKERVVQRQGALALSARHCWVDVAALARCLQRARETPRAGRQDRLAALAALDRGPLLPADDTALVAQRRSQLQRELTAVRGEAAP